MDRSNWKFKFSSNAQVVTGDFTSWIGRVRLWCTHIKDPRAERAKLLFSFVKYANFWCLVLFNKNWQRFSRQFIYSYVGLMTDLKRMISLCWTFIYNSAALERLINGVQITEHSYDQTFQGIFGSKRKAKNSNLRDCNSMSRWLRLVARFKGTSNSSWEFHIHSPLENDGVK